MTTFLPAEETLPLAESQPISRLNEFARGRTIKYPAPKAVAIINRIAIANDQLLICEALAGNGDGIGLPAVL